MVSLYEASHGYTANTTASRDSSGAIVGGSSGSNYAREEAQKNTFSAYQTQNEKLQQQIKAVEQEKPKTNIFQQQQQQQQNPGMFSRIKSSFSQGYAAGEGKNYSLAGLTKPKTQANDLYTYPIYEKANKLSLRYDVYQNSLLSPLPSGTVKSFLTGVSNVPEMAINSLGSIPLGTESIIRNPKQSTESISLGLGVMAGATVQKAKTNPAELGGEVLGSLFLAKAGGSFEAKIKPGFSSPGFKSFKSSETASLTPQKLIFKESPKSKIKPIQGKQPNEINKISMGADVKLTPEMERVLFSKPTKTAASTKTAIESRDIFSPEMTAPTEFKISSIKGKQPKIKNTITGFEPGKISKSQGALLFPSFALTLPLMQGINLKTESQKESSIPVFNVPSINPVSQNPIINSINPVSQNPIIDSINPVIDPINPKIDPINPKIDPINPKIDPINPKIDPFFIPVFDPKIIFPMGGGGWDFNRALNDSPRKRKRTKNKTLKNAYGDPLNVKINLKL